VGLLISSVVNPAINSLINSLGEDPPVASDNVRYAAFAKEPEILIGHARRHRIDGVGEPLVLALHPLPTGDLTLAG
jgi:hypothetical protein